MESQESPRSRCINLNQESDFQERIFPVENASSRFLKEKEGTI